MDPYFFDPIFGDGAFTEDRLEAAGVRIKQLFDCGEETEASSATRLLADMLLLAIADGRTTDPQKCACHYLTVTRAALGHPTLLDEVQRRVEGTSSTDQNA